MSEAIKAYRGPDYNDNNLRTTTLHHVVDAIALGLIEGKERESIDLSKVISPCKAAENCNGCALHSSIPFTLIGHISRHSLGLFNVELRGTCTGFEDDGNPLEDNSALLTLEADPKTDHRSNVAHEPNYKPPCGLNMVRIFNGTGVEVLT